MFRKIHIPTFGFTGGPCSGKTTVLSFIARNMTEKGYTPYIVPEAATILISMGAHPSDLDFQSRVLETILLLEKIAYESAVIAKENGKNPIILCDRGICDAMAYVGEKEFEKVIKKADLSIVDARDTRYDGIFHLITSASGAEEFYTLENNFARSETPEQARALDHKTQNAWVGHSHFKVIDNSTDFEHKKKRVLEALCHSLGIPVPLEIEYKYLIDSSFTADDIPKEIHRVTLDITQHYLVSVDALWEERVRKRSQGSDAMYTHTLKRPTPDGKSRFEKERIITQHEYVMLLEKQHADHFPIRKKRTCFLYNNQYFELDKMESPFEGRTYCELEVTSLQEIADYPNWLPVLENVTGSGQHSMKFLSRK